MTALAVAEGPAGERWRPRLVQRLGLWSLAGVRFKAYGLMATARDTLPDEAVEAARLTIAGEAALVTRDPRRGFGFVILHREGERLWLAAQWWQDEGTLAGLAWQGKAGPAPGFAPIERPVTTCVWELALADHERRAWMRTAMGPAADADAYLDDIFRQDFC